MSDSSCSAKSLFYISALCLVQAAAQSCQGSFAVPQSLCSLLPASQPIPGVSQYLEMTGVFPVPGDGLALCSAAAVLAPLSLVGMELCFQAAVTAVSPQPEKLERNRVIEFHLALELCFWAVSRAETTPPLAEQPGQCGGELVFLLPAGLCPLGMLVPC